MEDGIWKFDDFQISSSINERRPSPFLVLISSETEPNLVFLQHVINVFESNNIWCLTQIDPPRDILLPKPPGTSRVKRKMEFSIRVILNIYLVKLSNWRKRLTWKHNYITNTIERFALSVINQKNSE